MRKILKILFLCFALSGVLLGNAQNVNLSGKVSSVNGETIPGVNIIIKGITVGNVRNFDGDYTMADVNPESTLIFSFIGFQTLEVPINGLTVIDVTLIQDAIGIEEVVAVGYGSLRKSDVTGSIVSVKSEELMERPSTNLGQALQGKASGVMVRNTSSAPGGGVSIIIRGHNSVNSGSEPLYVVDGVPLTNINTIPVEDIESVEVLKDASSTAIYGSRGSNGVILITTKKGKAGRAPEISYSTRFTMETLTSDLNLMNGEEFATFYSEWELALDPDMNSADVWYNGAAYDRPLPQDVGEGTDWFKEITRTGLVQNHILSLSGGSEKSTYALSASYLNHKGIMISGQYDRINIKSAVTSEVTNWLDAGLNMFLSHDEKTNSGENTSMEGRGNIINQAIKMSPALPLYTEDGDYQPNSTPASQSIENPVGQALEVEDYDRTNRVFGNIYLNFKPTKDLAIKVSVGGDVKSKKDYYYDSSKTQTGRLLGGRANLSVVDDTYIINENILSYKKEIGDHKFDVVGGFTYEQATNERLGAGATGFFTDAYLYNNLAAASTYSTPSSWKSKWSLASGLARVNYKLANKYVVQVAGRYDGSSRFGEGNKWGFFPTVGGAWVFSEELFMEDIDWLTFGKLRGSWGENGNQNIGLYNSLATYGLANYPIGNKIMSGVKANKLSNPDLKWETTETIDIGVDVGLFNCLTLNLSVYKKKTSDLLMGVSLIETSGFNSAKMNTGEIENKGWEFSADAKIIDKEIKWNAMASIFQNRNKITELSDATQQWKIGYSTGADRGFLVDGIIRNQTELDAYSDPDGVPISGAAVGDYRRIDLNGDYKINGDDRTIFFDPEPDFTFSLNNEVSWKDLSLSVFLHGSTGGQVYNATKSYMLNGLNVRNNMSGELLSIENGVVTKNYWTEDNPDAEYAALGASSQAHILVEDGTYLKIQDIMLSYNLPLKNIFSKATIYCSVQNLYTFTNYSGWDPDVSSVNSNVDYGIDRASHPVPRSFTMGLNITF